jgi:hypothetical protein
MPLLVTDAPRRAEQLSADAEAAVRGHVRPAPGAFATRRRRLAGAPARPALASRRGRRALGSLTGRARAGATIASDGGLSIGLSDGWQRDMRLA